MNTTTRKVSEQTGSLIKALEYVLLAQEELLSNFHNTYGEESGESMYSKDFETQVESLKTAIKGWIGESMEVNMGYIGDNLY
jgi:hypothetical protein